MAIFKSLLKNEFFAFLSVNNMFDSKKGKIKSKDSVIMVAIGLCAILMFTSFIYSRLMVISLISINAVHIMPTYIFVVGCIAVFFFTALKSSEILFKAKDYDLLFSLPISNKAIILSKLAGLYFSELIFSLILMLPSLFVWCYYDNVSPVGVLLVSLSLLFIPIIPLILATTLGTVIAFLAGKFRYKTLVTILANLVMIFGVMFFSTAFSASSTSFALGEYALMMQNSLTASYPPAKLFFEASQGNILSFTIFIVISVTFAVIFVTLVSLKFKNISSKLTSMTVKSSNKKLTYTTSGVFLSLVKKESKRFFASPLYVLNCGIGPLMGVGGTLYLLFFAGDFLNIIKSVPPLVDAVTAFAPLFVAIATSLCHPTSASVSMEGQSIWIPKHMPISAYSFFMAKVAFSLIISLVCGVFMSIVLAFLFGINGFTLLWLIVAPITMSTFLAYFGLYLNIKFPKFEWSSEAKVVKQSAPVAISTFSSMGICGAIFLSIASIAGYENAGAVYLVSSLVFLLGIFFINRYLKQHAEDILINF